MNPLPYSLTEPYYRRTKTVKTQQFIYSVPFVIVIAVCMVLLNGTNSEKFAILVFSVFLILLLIDAVLTYTKSTSQLFGCLFDRGVKLCLVNAFATATYFWVAIVLAIFTGISWA